MEELRIHGRGGQGAVSAAIILAKALFKAGYYVQSFPVFGVERRGAPVEAYLRWDRNKILVRSNVYTPDHVMVQDAKLIGTVKVTQGLKPGGLILLNIPRAPADLTPFEGFRLAFVDATRIAAENRLGTRTFPITNTTMTGALAKVLGKPSLEILSEVIAEEIPVKPQENIRAATLAYETVMIDGLAVQS